MKLYIIGNGFDLHHGLDTSYQSFAFYLQDHHRKIHDNLHRYYGLPYLDRDQKDDHWDPWWANFEQALADLDIASVLDDHSDSLPNVGSDDFRDADWHTLQIEMQMLVDDLTKNLFKAFKDFITKVRYPTSINDKRLLLDKDAYYLNFNYTHTLEYYYNIPKAQILYIHGNAQVPDASLVLGHGIDPDTFEEEEIKPPPGLSDEELMDWHDQRADEYDYSYESGKAELMQYFGKSFKPTKEIIEENAPFFNKLSDVDEVIIMGHSLSSVDLPYILKVLAFVQEDAIWSASYFKDSEYALRQRKLLDLGIEASNIRLFKLNELRV